MSHHAVFPTRWNDNDQYGHVNNAVYYEAMDTTVNTWLISAGLIPVGGSAIAVCRTSSCDFLASIAFPDLMRVGLRVGRLGTTSVTWDLTIHRIPSGSPTISTNTEADPEPAATGRFVHVFVDAETRRPVPIPAGLRSVIERDLTA